MFDPSVGRFLSEDPKGFGPGDPNLYRYVRNSPTNATDPSGMQPMVSDPASRDEQAEEKRVMGNRFVNVGKAITGSKLLKQNPTLIEDKNYTGAKLNGMVNGSSVSFRFEQAYSGTFEVFVGKDFEKAYGVHVKIAVDVVPAKGKDFDEIRLIQVVRTYTKDRLLGAPWPADPVDPLRRQQCAWDNPNAPSPGWMVDYLESPTGEEPNLYYAYGGSGIHSKRRAVLFDSPFFLETGLVPARNHGKEFYTVAIGWYKDKKKPPEFLGAVRWGFFVNDNLQVALEPAKPEFLTTPPKALGDAIAKIHSLLLFASKTEKLEDLLGKLPNYEGTMVIPTIEGVQIPPPPKFVPSPPKN